MTDRLISLTVGTSEAEEWFRTFQELSELTANLGVTHKYVSISSSIMSEEDDEPTCDPDGLYHDEYTLAKVREAIKRGVDGLNDLDATQIINELQNAGILFRERPPKS